MILAIDIGNTTVSLAGIERDPDCGYRVCFRGRMETDRSRRETACRQGILDFMEKEAVTIDDFEGVVMSSVVPTVQDAVQETIRSVFGYDPMIITLESDLGLEVNVLKPHKIGRDRLVDSAWAAARYPLPVVTCDLGTATTFNLIEEGPVLQGGVIAAGLETGLKALASRTAQLPALELRMPEKIIGKDTASCMISGAVAGTAAILDGIVTDIEEEIGKQVTLVITGGGAWYVDSLVRHPHIHEPALILKGLAYLYDRNKK